MENETYQRPEKPPPYSLHPPSAKVADNKGMQAPSQPEECGGCSYIQHFIDKINKDHQITHLCVAKMVSSTYITNEFIRDIKNKYGLRITVIPFNKILFENIHEDWTDEKYTADGLTDGLYILIDSLDSFIHFKYIGIIQRKIGVAINDYKKKNNINPTIHPCSWTMHYLSDRRHKWVGN